jgi:hypothetical protein
MKPHKPALVRFAVCVENSEYPASLELHKMYRVLPDEEAAEDGDVRIIDESGEDYLYPAEYFVVLEVPRQTAQALTKSFIRNARHAA